MILYIGFTQYRVTMSKQKYSIIACGYTSRLVNYFAFDIIEEKSSDSQDKYHSNGVYRISHSHSTEKNKYEHIQDDDDCLEISDIDTFLSNCIFIKDGLWGKGLYKLGDDGVINDIIELLNTRTRRFEIDGIICFKSDDYETYINILEQCHFCAFCNMESVSNITTIENDNTILTVYDLDTESG